MVDIKLERNVIGDKTVLCVVTARAGSKGIPGKNFRELLGKPLFMWSVLAAEQSQYVDGVILSSDCQECLRIFDEYRMVRDKDDKRLIGWILRPDEYSTDISKNEEAIIHTLEMTNEAFDVVINLQPTSPCRISRLLDNCLKLYGDGNYNSLLTATKDTPFLWQLRQGNWEYVIGDDCCKRPMRQEIFEDKINSDFLMHDNGNIYITDVDVMLETRCRIGDKHVVYETYGINSLQIDTEFDFLLIEQIAKVKNLESLI